MKTFLPLALFSLLWLDLIRQLSYTWETREQYAYGWFVPILALGLFLKKWPMRPRSEISSPSSPPPPPSALESQPPAPSQSPGVPASQRPSVPVSAFQPSAFIPHPSAARGLVVLVVLLCVLLLPLRLIHEINQDWPLITWPYTLIVVLLTLYAFHLAGPKSEVRSQKSEVSGNDNSISAFCFRNFCFSPWLTHFFFPVAFILVAVSWPYRIEKGLTQNLQQVVSALSVEALTWLNIPAIQRGNLIELTTGTVGVDEACSGIRSFQSTLMAALFLGELYLFRWPIRLALVAGGLLLAFGLNIIRALILTWQAEKHGLSAIDKWHDSAGFTIAIACFFALWALALLIKKFWSSPPHPSEVSGPHSPPPHPSAFIPQSSEMLPSPISHLPSPGSAMESPLPAPSQSPGVPKSQSPSVPESPFQPSAFIPQPSGDWRRYAIAIGLWSLLCIGATEAWYRSNEARVSKTNRWFAQSPTNTAGVSDVPISKGVWDKLGCDQGFSFSWDSPDQSHWQVFFLRWNAGSLKSRLGARSHRPENCLPASGYTLLGYHGMANLATSGISLNFQQYVFSQQGQPLFVFFCLAEDGGNDLPMTHRPTLTDRVRVSLAGKRLVAHQTLEVIVSGYQNLDEARNAVQQRLSKFIHVESQVQTVGR